MKIAKCAIHTGKIKKVGGLSIYIKNSLDFNKIDVLSTGIKDVIIIIIIIMVIFKCYFSGELIALT